MAHALLLEAIDLPTYGLGAEFLAQFDGTDVIATKLRACTDEMLGYIGPAFTFPLTAWGSDLKQKVADLVVYELKSWLGIASSDSAAGDANIIARAERAREWGKAIGAGTSGLQDVTDSTPSASDLPLDARSDDSRGW